MAILCISALHIDSKIHTIFNTVENSQVVKKSVITPKEIWQKIYDKASTSIAHAEMLENYIDESNRFDSTQVHPMDVKTKRKIDTLERKISRLENLMQINEETKEMLKDLICLNRFNPIMKTLHKKYGKTFREYQKAVQKWSKVLAEEWSAGQKIYEMEERFFDSFALTYEEKSILRDLSSIAIKVQIPEYLPAQESEDYNSGNFLIW